MEKWIDWSFMNDVLHLIDPDIWHMFGMDPTLVQYALVAILVLSLSWVIRPLVEWMMIHHWSVLTTFLTSAACTIIFLQAVDRYAMRMNQSPLPDTYWTICLLGMTSAGVLYLLQHMFIKMWRRKKKKARKQVA